MLLAAMASLSRSALSSVSLPRLNGPETSHFSSSSGPIDSPGHTTLVWSNPESVLIVRNWTAAGMAQLTDGTTPCALGPDDVLFVRVERGDWVSASVAPSSVALQFGYADGASNSPDTIVWLPLEESRVHVPTWNSSPYVAIRSRSTAQIRVAISAREVDPLAWFHLDGAVSNWARSGVALPDHSRSDVRRIFAALKELRDSIAEPQRKQAAPTLIGLWLEESARSRPLSRPFFLPLASLRETEQRVLVGPARVKYTEAAADVHRWQIRTKGSARLIIREGTTIARIMQWQPSSTDTESWTTLQNVRTVALDPTAQPELEVASGIVSVALQGFSYRPELRESLGLARRRRQQLWSEAPSGRVVRWRAALAESGDTHPSRVHEQSALNSYLALQESQSSLVLNSAISSAWSGLHAARSNAWQTLLSNRLLDLAVFHAELEQRRDDATVPTDAFDSALNRSRNSLQPLSANGYLGSPDTAATTEPTVTTIERSLSASMDGSKLSPRSILREALLPSRLSRRPIWGQAVESWAMARDDDAPFVRLATQYWRAFPYRTVAPATGTATSARLVPVGGSGFCNPARDNVEAWFVPIDTLTEIKVDVEPGVYAVATLRPIGESPAIEGEVTIDGTPVTIHSGSGLSSRVALSRGTHVIVRNATTPGFAMEATEGMLLPCSGLFRWHRWSNLPAATTTEFPLPNPGAATVARVRFDGVVTRTSLKVGLGSRRFEIVTRPPATGTAEFPIDAGDDVLSLSSAVPVSVLLALRRELDPVALPQSFPRPNSSASTGGAQDEAGATLPTRLLAELFELGQMIRSKQEPGSALELRQQRARLLVRLGFAALATRDGDTGAAIEPRSDLIRIDDATAKVIPTGILSTIGPLRLPSDQTALVARRAAWRDSAGADCAGGLHRLGQASATAETLLEAFCAERIGLSATAADLYAHIAQSLHQGSVLVHAASLLADAAETARDRQLGLRSAIWAARAMAWGDSASGLRARLSQAIHWVTPSILNGAAGVTAIAHGQAESPTNRQRVLESLVGAQPNALLVEDRQAAELLVNSRQMDAILVRFGSDAPAHSKSCALVATLDGATAPCAPNGSQNGCTLSTPAGKHRVRFKFDGEGCIGWVATELGHRSLAPTITSDWSVLETERKATVTVRGPTVLRLRARGSGQRGESISVEGCDIEQGNASLALPTGPDPSARYWPNLDQKTQIGLPLERWIPITAEATCELRIGARQPNTKLHLSFARADGLPAPRLATQISSAPAPVTSSAPAHGDPAAYVPTLPRVVVERQPVLVGARTRFVSESLSVALEQDSASSEGAFQDVYGEASAFVARELVGYRWWGTLQAGARFRNGPGTEFAKLSFDMPPLGSLPGVDLTSSIFTQSFGAIRSTTLSTTGKLARRWDISPKAAVIPQFGFTTLRVGDEAAGQAGVDGDVYSNFYATHPRYVSLATTLATRPYVDTLVNFSISSRSLPRLDGMDRLSATAELIFLPVPSWPLLGGLDWMSSYRPASSLRAEMFIRHDFGIAWGLWHWVTPSERIRWFGRVDFFFDAPAAMLGSVIVAPTMGIELLSGGARGLRDLSPQQVPMREFQERGSSRIRVGRAGTLDDAPTSGATP